MYVDAEFCQRKCADTQLNRHNKGPWEEFALDVCANTNRELHPVEAAAVNIKSLLTPSLSNPLRSETGCEQQQRLSLCGPRVLLTNAGADSRRLHTQKMNERKVYLNALNQILHDYFCFFDRNSDISKSALCASATGWMWHQKPLPQIFGRLFSAGRSVKVELGRIYGRCLTATSNV